MELLLSLILKYLILLIRIYQLIISPFLINFHCRFQPTCSQYGIEVIYRFGFLKGFFLLCNRIFKCHPLNPGGEDPVPLKILNDRE